MATMEESIQNIFHAYATGQRKYLDMMFQMMCTPDLLAHNLYPNAKEFTESAGAWWGIKKYLKNLNPGDSTITAVVVGDGVCPRTGAMLAYRTKWDIYSVDPLMRVKDYGIDRLTCIPSKIEDLTMELNGPVVIVCVHSHATYEACLEHINGPERYMISIPCCVPYPAGNKEYTDSGILSPKNHVKIYRRI